MKASERQIEYIISLYKNISGDYIPDKEIYELSFEEASKLIDKLKKEKQRLRTKWRYGKYY